MRYLLILAFAAGCSQNNGTGMPGPEDMAVPSPDIATVPLDLAGAKRMHFVMDHVLMPDSSSEATKYLYDVDGTGPKRNKMVAVLDALKIAGGAPLQETVDSALLAGTLIQLLLVEAIDTSIMNDDGMRVQGFAGVEPMGQSPATNFSGSAAFDLDLSEQPAQHWLNAAATSGKVTTLHLPYGSFPIHFPLQGIAPLAMTVYGAHVSFVTTARTSNGMTTLSLSSGVLNGGLSNQQVQDRLVPAVAMMLQQIVDAGPNTMNAMTVLMQFDKNKDGKVSADEVRNHPIVSSILEPDCDLFDGSGNLAPNTDKMLDSISFGVGFTAVGAQFTEPVN